MSFRRAGSQFGLMFALTSAALWAQSPSPPLPPDLNLPALSPAPTERSVPPGPDAQAGPATKAKEPEVSALAGTAPPPNAPAPQITAAQGNTQMPQREDASGLVPRFLGFLGPYRRPTVPQLFPGSETRLESLIRDGKLYLTLQDAIALALENNLDVETERYNLVLGCIDTVRAAGGGSTRGIDYSIQEML